MLSHADQMPSWYAFTTTASIHMKQSPTPLAALLVITSSNVMLHSGLNSMTRMQCNVSTCKSFCMHSRRFSTNSGHYAVNHAPKGPGSMPKLACEHMCYYARPRHKNTLSLYSMPEPGLSPDPVQRLLFSCDTCCLC